LSPIDLHSHSSWSDGALSPAALVERAAARGVQVLALTDHDTVDGLDEARTAAQSVGVHIIAGVEVSVSWSGRTLHVVGLGVDPREPALVRGLEQVRAGRLARAEAIAQRLDRLGIGGVLTGALALASNPAMVGRTHIARHMVSVGAVKDTKAAFRRYLGEGKPGYVKHQWARLCEAVAWIRAAGGVAVLAHPGRYDLSPARLVALLQEFRDLGGEAVEVVTASHTPDQVQRIAALVGDCGLNASIGSDFHDPDESWMDLGAIPDLPSMCRPVWHGWEIEKRGV